MRDISMIMSRLIIQCLDGALCDCTFVSHFIALAARLWWRLLEMSWR